MKICYWGIADSLLKRVQRSVYLHRSEMQKDKLHSSTGGPFQLFQLTKMKKRSET